MSQKKTSSSAPRRPGRGPAAPARPTQSPPIVRAMVIQALQTWVVPAVSGSAIVAFWLLSIFDAVSEATAVLGVAGSLLVLVLFLSFQQYFFADDRTQRLASAGFALLWAFVLYASFYRHDFPGPPVAAGMLRPDGQTVGLPSGGRVSIVAEGRFAAGENRGNRAGQYRLEVVANGTPAQSIDGTFEDRFDQRRLGRRGSTTVEVQRTTNRHDVSLPSDGATELRLTDIDKTLAPELHVAVYPGVNPWLFPLIGVAGIVGALALEKWFDGDGSALMAASVTFFVVDQYMRWAPPHPQLKPLVGAILVGSFIGTPLAAVLWRIVPRRWFVTRSVR